MLYLITFLEGIISFISPCMLPMLPLYLSYFAGDAGKHSPDAANSEEQNPSQSRVFLHACAFVVGFSVVFIALGVFAGSLGMLLTRYQTILNIVCGAIVILLGLSYLEIIRIPFFTGMKTAKKAGSVLSAFVFGVIYSVSLTPCIGAFLGSALMMASSSGGAVRGALLLLCYTAGLGIPFLISAVLIDGLQSAFRFIKQHYRVINVVSGIFLIVIGLCMMLGWMNRLMALFS
ncbi:MAG: sulfite exporter TauE/SafE family protein [Clostridia bacterium]|nr:sulfite exporter TauE/SafE family protein [Clostridia bacterium]